MFLTLAAPPTLEGREPVYNQRILALFTKSINSFLRGFTVLNRHKDRAGVIQNNIHVYCNEHELGTNEATRRRKKRRRIGKTGTANGLDCCLDRFDV